MSRSPQNSKTSRTQTQSSAEPDFIRWFETLSLSDLPAVGGKNASLGEMYRHLAPLGIRVPNGFAVTVDAYRHFLRSNQLESRLEELLRDLDPSDVDELRRKGRKIRSTLINATLPEDLADTILSAYQRLSVNGHEADVAVRSSATAEDLPDASFAGQQETYLNVQGEAQLLETCKRCFASLFTDRAITYRQNIGYSHMDVGLSIGIQKMVRSDLASAGVLFTLDTDTGFREAVLINAAYGLGENVVQGSVNPDEFLVFKTTLRDGYRPILQKTLGSKEYRLVYDTGGSRMVRNVPVPEGERKTYALTDDEILELARWSLRIEEHYSRLHGKWTPMDIEWAKDGQTGELFIVQARPETVQVRKSETLLETYELKAQGPILVTGRAIGSRITKGRARIIHSVRELNRLQPGEILVTDRTDPDWEPIMKRAAAIVTNRGGRTAHAAIVARELGLPAIVGATGATDTIVDGQFVTISCAQGDTGYVYDGELPFDVQRIDLGSLPRPKTRIMMNLGNPNEALSLSFLPCDGIGLAREEFIISNFIGIHPRALLDYEKLKDPDLRQQIADLTIGYEDKSRFFVDRLAQGVAILAAAFYPREVIVRLSDFKTNEYAGLLGGHLYEPHEENPMLGFRGASRYTHPLYRDGFALECQALRAAREEMGLKNLKIMVPFCRTVTEGRRVIEEMARHGLNRGEDGLEIYVMCEIPSNVILAEEFAAIFDGFSIGSNDLTQLVLGVDRDSEIIADLFDERNEAVLKMISQVIQTVKRCGRKIGICGQAPSDYPEFAAFLVRKGIDSISLNPDAVLKTTQAVVEMEKHDRLSPSEVPPPNVQRP